MRIGAPFVFRSYFFNNMFRRDRSRADFRTKFTVFGLKKAVNTKKTGCSESFTLSIQLLNIAAERAFPVIYAEHSLKTAAIVCGRNFFCLLNAFKHLIVIRPFESFLPDTINFIEFT